MKRESRNVWETAAMAFAVLLGAGFAQPAYCAGILTPQGAGHQPIKIEDHDVSVVINNGFARTEVVQAFFNPNDTNLEAEYSFPLPKSASLSEVQITAGEKTINGEVVPKDKAEKVYEDEKSKGNDAGLASKNGYQDFRFKVSRVRAQDRVTIKFVYYQPLEIDTGMGRYLYPLEEGGTDEVAESFWTRDAQVEGALSIGMELKSAFPLSSVRSPGYVPVQEEDKLAEGLYKARYEIPKAKLEKDFVFYYRLQDNLPGRVEVIPYKAAKDKPGAFMMVVTPGLDLKPLSKGADYIFVLDVSGSMADKIKTLAQGVAKALGKLSPEDRFRIITFDTNARELSNGWIVASEPNVRKWIEKIEGLRSSGSTNLFDAMRLCMENLDADRASSVVLVTDGVTNTGVVSPVEFHKLMKKYDVRIFGFLMGNNSNWPLMRTICDASGGYYTGVSNSDDIIGQIMKAKGKVTYECLHDATLAISGVKVFDSTNEFIGKVYHGQQLVVFGRYKEGGKATVKLNARLTGEDKVYSTEFEFPDVDTDNPEIERLWALRRIEMIEGIMNSGLAKEGESKTAIRDLGVGYQLVTDETLMLVLSDAAFEENGIERKNLNRLAVEKEAQSRKSGQAAKSYQVDNSRPAFNHSAPSLGGGGAIDPFTVIVIVMIASLGAMAYTSAKMKDHAN